MFIVVTYAVWVGIYSVWALLFAKQRKVLPINLSR